MWLRAISISEIEAALLIHHDLRSVGLRLSPIHFVKRVFQFLRRACRRVLVFMQLAAARRRSETRHNDRGRQQRIAGASAAMKRSLVTIVRCFFSFFSESIFGMNCADDLPKISLAANSVFF